MRRASRILVPVALLGFLGLGFLAFEGKLNLPRVDLASLLQWGDRTAQDLSSVISKATPTEPSRLASVGAPASGGTKVAPGLAELTSMLPRASGGKEPSGNGLKIEFARLDAEGTSVIGGHAPAGSRVSIRANGEVVAVVTASDDGQWSAIVTRTFPAGPVALSITSDASGMESPIVTVQVPKGSGRVELAAAAAKARPILPAPAPSAQTRAVNEFAAMVERARSGKAQEGGAKPQPAVVPVPITFVTGEASMTAEGARAARLLAEYVRIMKPHTITLSGHADVRGGEDYNFDLSRQRLETIRSYLRESGYTGELALLAKGKSEPYQGIDRKTASLQEIYQADRRVELRLAE